MSSIKKLAGETFWYGVSSIVSKFMVQLLTPYLTAKFKGTPEFGQMALVYAATSFINIAVLFGLDYAYFRYINKKEIHGGELYSTLLVSLFSSTMVITTVIILFHVPPRRSARCGQPPRLYYPERADHRLRRAERPSFCAASP